MEDQAARIEHMETQIKGILKALDILAYEGIPDMLADIESLKNPTKPLITGKLTSVIKEGDTVEIRIVAENDIDIDQLVLAFGKKITVQ